MDARDLVPLVASPDRSRVSFCLSASRVFRSLIVCGAAASIGSGCGDAPIEPITQGGDFTRSFESGGRSRTFSVHVPPSVDVAVPAPVVLLFHGVPRGRGMRVLTGFDGVADELGFIAVYPNSFQADWAVGCEFCTSAAIHGVDDVKFVSELIDQLDGAVAIDRSRVFAAGFSQGALMVHLLGCRLSQELAGVASVAATMLAPVAEDCDPDRPLAALFIHGTEDPEFPWEGLAGELVTSLGAEATVATWAGLYGCDPTPMTASLPDREDDGTVVERQIYSGCRGPGRLDFYVVEGGGHTWPGAPVDFSESLGRKSLEIDAGRTIAAFFGLGQ